MSNEDKGYPVTSNEDIACLARVVGRYLELGEDDRRFGAEEDSARATVRERTITLDKLRRKYEDRVKARDAMIEKVRQTLVLIEAEKFAIGEAKKSLDLGPERSSSRTAQAACQKELSDRMKASGQDRQWVHLLDGRRVALLTLVGGEDVNVETAVLSPQPQQNYWTDERVEALACLDQKATTANLRAAVRELGGGNLPCEEDATKLILLAWQVCMKLPASGRRDDRIRAQRLFEAIFDLLPECCAPGKFQVAFRASTLCSDGTTLRCSTGEPYRIQSIVGPGHLDYFEQAVSVTPNRLLQYALDHQVQHGSDKEAIILREYKRRESRESRQ